jgi:hypothetical protein
MFACGAQPRQDLLEGPPKWRDSRLTTVRPTTSLALVAPPAVSREGRREGPSDWVPSRFVGSVPPRAHGEGSRFLLSLGVLS